MASTLVLQLPNFILSFEVQIDALGTAMGMILSQVGHPLQFCSTQLTTRLCLTSTYAREMYTIMEAIRKWR